MSFWDFLLLSLQLDHWGFLNPSHPSHGKVSEMPLPTHQCKAMTKPLNLSWCSALGTSMTLMCSQGHPCRQIPWCPLVAPAAVPVDAFLKTLWELLSVPAAAVWQQQRWAEMEQHSQTVLCLRSTRPSLTNHCKPLEHGQKGAEEMLEHNLRGKLLSQVLKRAHRKCTAIPIYLVNVSLLLS